MKDTDHYKFKKDHLSVEVVGHETHVVLRLIIGDDTGEAKGFERISVSIEPDEAQKFSAALLNAAIAATDQPTDDTPLHERKLAQRSRDRFERLGTLRTEEAQFANEHGPDAEWDPIKKQELEHLSELHKQGQL